MTGTIDKRRVARIPLACTVVVRERFATWTTETQDVGARGCRIALSRPLAPGALVRLHIERGDEPPLHVLGQVAWARKTRPLAAGITFLSAPSDPSGAPAGNWIDSLVTAALRRVLAAGATPTALAGLGDVTLHLGNPPSGSLEQSDLAVIRVARDRCPLSAVGYAPEGLRALIGLMERGAVTVRRTIVDPEGWKRAFSLIAADARAHRPAAAGSSVIVPPLPETLWRSTAVEAMAAEYLGKP